MLVINHARRRCQKWHLTKLEILAFFQPSLQTFKAFMTALGTFSLLKTGAVSQFIPRADVG